MFYFLLTWKQIKAFCFLSYCIVFGTAMCHAQGATYPDHPEVIKSLRGDSILSDAQFVQAINKTCFISGGSYFSRTDEQAEQDNKRCVLAKVKFDYGKVTNTHQLNNNKKLPVFKINDLSGFIKKTKNKAFDDNLEVELTLYTEKNNKIIDKLLIYRNNAYGQSYSAKIQYYYIDKNLTLWLLQIIETEEGSQLAYWKKYKINQRTGKMKLEKSKLAKNP